MKKTILVFILAIICIGTTGCVVLDSGVEVTKNDGNGTNEPTLEEPTATPEDSQAYGIGDEVIIKVDGVDKYSLVINSVKKTDERSEYYTGPEVSSVIVINYTYKNINSDTDIYLTPMLNFKLMDGQGNMCEPYTYITDLSPQQTIKGAKCTAEMMYGIIEDGGTVRLNFYDNFLITKADAVFEFVVE